MTEMKKIILELRVPKKNMSMVNELVSSFEENYDFKYDRKWRVSIPPAENLTETEQGEPTICVRGEIPEDKIKKLKKAPNVENVWMDSKIAPFTSGSALEIMMPCDKFDCGYTIAKGDLKAVADYLGVNYIWDKGYKGKDICIGICDTGVDKGDVPAFEKGWSPNPSYQPGTDSDENDKHGTMTAFDASYICPEAKIYDIGVLKGQGGVEGTLSDAMAGYQWAIDSFKNNKTPNIMSNSWGIYQESWAPDYARDPKYPFTRKVIEAINSGIIVTFAAGNCGPVCPSTSCGYDIGAGHSIWGANGLAEVITIGAANIREEWIGYSSIGPASLNDTKPDVCSISHFKGYHGVDTGTSSANPIAAGVIGLLMSAKDLSPAEALILLKETSKDICSKDWNYYSGAGIINAKEAFIKLMGELPNDKEFCKDLAKARDKIKEGLDDLNKLVASCKD